MSNQRIYAWYERLAARRPVLGEYASFSYMIPIAARQPDDEHHLAIAIDHAAGTVRWLTNNDEVYRVDRIGNHLPTREHMTLDHGGSEV